jgi:hypothetical protein
MKYLMAGLDKQSDKGFGINADAFKKAADQLSMLKEYNEQFLPQKHMPIFYLYRHSIELYFKSIIFLFHQELNIPYGNNSNKSQILMQNGKWRDLDNCHWIDALYWYWAKIIVDKSDELKVSAPEGDWRVHPDLKRLISNIIKYDKDSTYFRYPFSKNDPGNKDKEKYTMKKVNDLEEIFKKASLGKGGFTFIIKDDDDNIKSVYSHDDNVLIDLFDAFRESSDILSNYHIMTRMTLCDGF